MILLIDIGNSRIKWAVSEQGKLSSVQALEHGQAGFKGKLSDLWQTIPIVPDKVAISCVSFESVLSEIEVVINALWPNVSIIKAESQADQHGVINSYPVPEKLGVDRWLSLVAARAHWQTPVCIADCGSAVTVDVMTGEGRHLGGLICPGITMMKHALAVNTAALKFSNDVCCPGLANNTEAAIYNGTLFATAGLIKSVLEQQKEPVTLILTGGDAELVASILNHNAVIVQDIVLQGLNIAVEK